MRTIHGALVVAGAIALGILGCERRDMERPGERPVTEPQAGRGGERPMGEPQAAMERTGAGISYQISRVDHEGRSLVLRKLPVDQPMADERQMQAGRELTVDFAELERLVEGEERAEELARRLRVGQTVTVFLDENGKPTRIQI